MYVCTHTHMYTYIWYIRQEEIFNCTQGCDGLGYDTSTVTRVLQCVAVCASVLLCVAACCSVWQCVAVCCSVLQGVLQCVAVC